ncbi:MAG TPA: hypothetical protein VI259_23045 [Gemmatimonadaceae bacterium]
MRRVLLAALFAVPLVNARAQRVEEVRAGVAPSESPRKRLAPVASAVVPGTGQIILGNNRSIAYMAVEVIGWWRYRKHVNERASQEAAFKELARRVARSHFAPDAGDGNWTYYEMMRDYVESGDFTTSDNGTIVPPTDTSTFNGHVWLDALRTHSSTSEALAQYEQRAVKPELQWSWRNARLQWDLFSQLTGKRNDANRSANIDLLLLAGNHLLSMVDAFGTFRLQVRPAEGGGASLGASLSW